MNCNVVLQFYHNFEKKYRQNKKKVIIYPICSYNLLQDGLASLVLRIAITCKVVKGINKLINFFFITFIINFFVTIYTVYNFLDFKIFQNKQGLKLNIKKQDLNHFKEVDKK